MLGLVLLYWIGKYFYKLAEEHDKSQWGFAFLGIVVYYGGIFFFGIFFGIIAEIVSPGFLNTFNETILGLLALPFGILSCYLLYRYLGRKWKSENLVDNNDIDKIGKTE